MQYIVTPEIIKNATDFVPLAEKMAFVKTFAPMCVEKADRNELTIERDKILSLPQIYIDNQITKELYSLLFFVSHYLNIETGENFGVAEYDGYISAHLFEQLERLKDDRTLPKELKNKIYDILADYKRFKKLLDTEIYSVKETYNNPLDRILAAISVMSNPQSLSNLIEELKKLQEVKE